MKIKRIVYVVVFSTLDFVAYWSDRGAKAVAARYFATWYRR